MSQPLLSAHYTDASALAEAIAQRCDKGKATSTGWQACCPAHQDDTPSLNITHTTDKILLHCFAGCPPKAIVAALGLSMTDLFVHQRTETHRGKTITATYDYLDAGGTLVHQTVRFADKTFRQRRPDPARLDAWIWNLKGIEPVLYRLPEVRAAMQRGELVYVVEGEKDADALTALGLPATCNAMGAGKWAKRYSEALRGAWVVILPDHDAVGEQHAENVARALHGIAAQVKVVADVHTDATGSDVSDWLQAGHTCAELEALVEQTPVYTPAHSAPGEQAPDADGETPQQAAAALLALLPTLEGDDARYAAVLAALDDVAALDMRGWMMFKRQVKAVVPRMNLGDLDRARTEVKRMVAAHPDTADILTRVVDEEDIDGLAELARQDDDTTHDLTKRYRATPQGLMWSKPTKEGPTDVLLTNFLAHITSQIVEDDGIETRLHFTLNATRGAVSHTFRIPATQFAGMGWVTEQLGAEAIVLPGMTLKDHARAAVQILSPTIERRHVYTHIGWRQLETGWAYLHCGGAVGTDGLLAAVEVEPGNALAPYVLHVPASPAASQAALLASMQVLSVAPQAIVIPLYGALWRSLLGTCDLSVHLTGRSGMGKSALAALVQQHWGGSMDAKTLPGAWTSTANALEALAFQCKDAVLVIDDFSPRGSPAEVSQLHGKADRLFRAQGNRSARQRLDRSGRDRPAKPPRGLVVSTGEDIPQGQSLRARMCLLEVTPETVQWDNVTPCQADAASGLYAEAMAAFVQWLAPQYGTVLETLPGELITLRGQAVQTAHRRTPELIANLALGWRYFLTCAHDLGVLTVDECQTLWTTAWRTLGEVALTQQEYQADEDPVRRFLALLSATITAGQAHVQDASTYGPPPDPRDWGWTVRERTTPADGYQEWTPHGACVGYLDGNRLYLEPDASYSVVQRLAETQRAPLALTQRTMFKRMHEQRLIVRQPSQTQYTVVKRLGPAQTPKRVIDLALSSLRPPPPVETLGPTHLVETSNTSNTSNDHTQMHENKAIAPLLVFAKTSNNQYQVGQKPVTDQEGAPASARGGTDSVTGFAASVTGSVTAFVPVMSPQLIEKKEALLVLLKLLVSGNEQGSRKKELSSAPPAGSPIVGDWITPLSLDGVIIPAATTPPPYRIDAIEHDDHAVFYARLDVGAYWPLAQCERTETPALPTSHGGIDGVEV